MAIFAAAGVQAALSASAQRGRSVRKLVMPASDSSSTSHPTLAKVDLCSELDAALAPFGNDQTRPECAESSAVADLAPEVPMANEGADFTGDSSDEVSSAARALLALAPTAPSSTVGVVSSLAAPTASIVLPVTPPKPPASLLSPMQFAVETPSKTLCEDHTLPLYSPPSILKDSFNKR